MELPPALPGLDCVAIDRLSMGWSDGGLWHDIEWLAGRFWSADGRNRTIAWHHLVLAVGNFKRQPGRRLRPALDAQLDYNPPPAPANFDVPGTDPIVNVVVGDPETWDALSEALPGSGVATTTT
ncbi:MAG: hypothetical protein ACXVJ3_18870, partial [Ilumatobacteraceae bacterium]